VNTHFAWHFVDPFKDEGAPVIRNGQIDGARVLADRDGVLRRQDEPEAGTARIDEDVAPVRQWTRACSSGIAAMITPLREQLLQCRAIFGAHSH